MTQEACYLNLLGAIIRQAIEDYVFYLKLKADKLVITAKRDSAVQNRKNHILTWGEDAKTWLFGKGIEELLETTGTIRMLDVDYIRRKVREIEDEVPLGKMYGSRVKEAKRRRR